MKFTRMMLLAGATAIALPAMAFAAGPQGEPQGEMGMGHGGMRGMNHPPMTKEQVEAKAADAYKDADVKKDGKVTMEEFSAHMKREQERRRAEFEAAMFKRLDSNKDGSLSEAEFKAGAQKMHEKREERRKKWQEHGKKRSHDRKGMMQDDEAQPSE